MIFSRFFPASIGVRLALAVNLLVVMGGISFLVVDYQRETRQRLADKEFALREQAMTLHQAVSALDRKSITEHQEIIDGVCGRMSEEDSPGHHLVVEFDGKALQSQAHHRASDSQLLAIRSASERASAGLTDKELIVGKHSEGGITVYVGEQMANVMAQIKRRTVLRWAVVVIFGLLLAVSINLVIHKLVHKPLRRLVRTIASISSGKYDSIVEKLEGTELARLADAVNNMSMSLAHAESRRRAVLDRARRVQGNLLPRNGRITGLDSAFFHWAAEDVAGDYLDIFRSSWNLVATAFDPRLTETPGSRWTAWHRPTAIHGPLAQHACGVPGEQGRKPEKTLTIRNRERLAGGPGGGNERPWSTHGSGET